MNGWTYSIVYAVNRETGPPPRMIQSYDGGPILAALFRNDISKFALIE